MMSGNINGTPVPQPIHDELKGKKVLGIGVAAVDFIATVEKFPQPDDKIKSTSLSVMGGGNAANTMTAIRRLGMPSAMLTKLGNDSNGDMIRSELEAEGVDTSMCVRQAGLSSPFTYIILDEMTKTRTCVHTPIQQELAPEEIPPTALDGVACLHCDSRSTIAAIAVAKKANERGIPVSLDIEKDRPHVRELLPLADWIFTNTRYPSIFAPGGESLEQGMAALLEHGRANLVATTLGEQGSVLMQRAGGGVGDVAGGEAHDDISTAVYREGGRTYLVTRCKSHFPDQVVDTTGAGDAYIGAMITGLVCGMPPSRAMLLASFVAGQKCGGMGARTALPQRHQVDQGLL